MAGNIGWASIQGGSIIGSENGIVVKVAGSQMSASGDIIWDPTAKTLTITGTSASATTLNITGKLAVSETTAPSITASTELYVGPYSKTLSDSGQVTHGNSLEITGNQVIPPDYRSLLYGPISVKTGACFAIATGAIIAVQNDDALPAILQS